ncbi:hypothetical protein ZIOFF_035639 [Zingiber officinale]|uniref:Uncharacterized protein n=1 Tax=Zingiber officinale TaxID=94328 RepID=A0A8J5G9H1_ZINOF|nr:hypothetical protein ZIOFF_035639 [Zingiber officinale]
MVSAQLWDWSRMEGLEVFNAWRSLSRHPKAHRIPLICSHGLYQPRPRRPWSTAKIKQHCYHLKMEGVLLSMASTQRLKLFQGGQAFPSNLHLHRLSKLGILRNLGDKESCKSNAFPTMFQGAHDPNEEKVVKSLRDTLLSKGQLPEKYDDYHTLLRFLFFSADFCDCGTSTCLRQISCLLICSSGEIVLVFILLQKFWILYRAKQDGPVVLGWRHPWEGHGDHSHDHVTEDKVL